MVSRTCFVLLTLLSYAAPAFSQAPATDAPPDGLELCPEPLPAEARKIFAGQVDTVKEVARLDANAGDTLNAQAALVQRAQALLASGRYIEATAALERARSLEKPGSDKARSAAIEVSLGNAYFAGGNLKKAEDILQTAVASAREADNPRVLAAAFINLGNVLAAQSKYSYASSAYARGMKVSRQIGDDALFVKAAVNRARVAHAMDRRQEAHWLLAEAVTAAATLEDSPAKAFALLSAGRLMQENAETPTDKSLETTPVHRTLVEAIRVAEAVDDARAISEANGYLGELYEQAERNEEAHAYTVTAIFYAQRVGAPELLYRWHWQRGRLYKAKGDLNSAIAAYRTAASHLKDVRGELIAIAQHGGRSYRESVGPLFQDLADLLLQSASSTEDQQKITVYLKDAQQAVEQLKNAELQDYFLDECLVTRQFQQVEVDRLTESAAILYPILLSDRIELLLTRSTGMVQRTVPVSQDEVTSVVRTFRKNLEKEPPTDDWRSGATQLYDWLIRPLEKELDDTDFDTLVVVPDGPLRTIPMAALHDGKGYLIERYALATTPGIDLTDPKPLVWGELQALLLGVSEENTNEKNQKLSALPAVELELSEIRRIVGVQNATVLKNEAFTPEKVQEKLTQRPYELVHIATHGEFAGNIEDSYVLAYEGKEIKMTQLEELMQIRRFSDEPIELLTLSACQTAAGDDRAALGLSGIAITAGARSALGTLWSPYDQPTAQLIAEFYTQLADPSVSKAKALQTAQIKMLQSNTVLKHPAYWAPFLLIGNWL